MTQGFRRGFGLAVSLVVLIAALASSLPCPAANDPSGDWVGKVKTPDGREAEIRLTLDKVTDGWAATLADTTMGAVTLTNVMVADHRISFTFQPAGVPYPAHFFGDYDPLEDKVSGTFSVRGTSRFVKFKRAPLMTPEELAATAAPKVPARIRHDYRLGAGGRIAFWAPVHVVKDEITNISTTTTGAMGMSLALKLYLQDGFCLFGRMYRGGQGFTDNQGKIGRFQDIGLTSASYLKLDGWEFGITGFLGNKILKTSAFNPYMTATAGRTSWEVTRDGRGSEVLVLERYPLEGTDFCFGIGLGTEYEINQRLQLEFELMWQFLMTKDETRWPADNNTWANTHVWALSVGATYGFY